MCGHLLGNLPCENTEPHKGNGRGCVHITGSYLETDAPGEGD